MGPAPLPLLGTFHEIGIAVASVREAAEFYERLAFSHATTTDAFTHPYGALTDGRVCIGVHERDGPSPVLTFVRPEVARASGPLERAGVSLTHCRTGDEIFNELGFIDPSGQAVAVLEARTYSPIDRGHTEPSLCGDFAEVSLPAADFSTAQGFWESLGFVAAEPVQAPYPHLPLTSDHLDLAFHAPQLCAQPMLVFRDAEMPARIARLRAAGLALEALPGAHPGLAARLSGPGGTVLLLLHAES